MLSALHLFPVADGIDRLSGDTVLLARNGDVLVMETKPAPGQASPSDRFDAVLSLGPGKGVSFTVQPGAVPIAGTSLAAADTSAKPADGGFLLALGGALLGGLILNVMPCVFPILSLKALGLARSGGSEHAARSEALAYAAGVLAVCLALGGILLALRAGGSQAGWAFQLQNPRVILFLLLLTVGIAFNLAGLFELPTIAAGGSLAARGGVAGAFWTGALAAFVATPCSGPFMAGAIGAALALSTPAALAVFAGLGIGLGLPFLLIGFLPALRRRLPKPGAWMDRLRCILSVPMFLTATRPRLDPRRGSGRGCDGARPRRGVAGGAGPVVDGATAGKSGASMPGGPHSPRSCWRWPRSRSFRTRRRQAHRRSRPVTRSRSARRGLRRCARKGGRCSSISPPIGA